MPTRLSANESRTKVVKTDNPSSNFSVQIAQVKAVELQTAPETIVSSIIVNRDDIKAMAIGYRTNHSTDPNCLKFIHFSLKEVMQLFIDNRVIDPAQTVNQQLNGLQFFGFKIYMGNHVDITTCPPSSIVPNPYLHMDTAVLCNTQLKVATRTWEDQLAPGTAVTILGAGEGLDRGSICPPNCLPSADPDGYFHQDILP